ncbi:AMP-binding protein [Roseomonas sp. NAR14]|uniref:Long-chain-fatty-acid--CoA ligase n=1 Tax=Roseomonas acroporae TaxID=2937791 RepID=A0A9X1Y6X8_9PROT|nr:AMP-binding protein [Roseomonas acroporae]MCK8784641.1 AMP-binding protein [Roseomonas acroporae]
MTAEAAGAVAPAHPSDTPWRAAFPEAADWDAPLPEGTVPALLDAAVARWADRPAIEFRDRTIGYRELGAMADGLAAGLLAEGIGPGDAVGLLLPNTPWHPVCFFAVARTGARVVHLSPMDAPRELAHKLRDSGARLVLTTDLPGILPTALRLLGEGAAERVLVGADARWGASGLPAQDVPWSDRLRPLDPLLQTPPPAAWPAVSPGDVLLLQYTGGTTGLPKGAMLTHGNLTAAIAIYRAWRDGVPAADLPRRVIAVLPLFHIFALTTILLRGVADGHELLLRTRFDVPTLLRDIAEKRATDFAGVPTMWTALVQHPEAAGCDFSSLRSATSGGAPMPFEIERRAEALVGLRLRGGWGMTETAPAGSRIPLGAAPRPGLIGIPLPGIELRVVSLDEPRRVLPPGESGEIAIRGPNVFKGYWNRPEETRAAFADGFFLTGDIGAMDAQGVFTLHDRRKNMIISSGFNVYPAAVEGAIHEHPDVAEVVVIGVPDAYRGQAAKAFVVPRPGAPAMTLESLREFLTDRLGRHEMPAALEIRDSLPRSPAGKLLARVLLEEERARAEATMGTDEAGATPEQDKREGTAP